MQVQGEKVVFRVDQEGQGVWSWPTYLFPHWVNLDLVPSVLALKCSPLLRFVLNFPPFSVESTGQGRMRSDLPFCSPLPHSLTCSQGWHNGEGSRRGRHGQQGHITYWLCMLQFLLLPVPLWTASEGKASKCHISLLVRNCLLLTIKSVHNLSKMALLSVRFSTSKI